MQRVRFQALAALIAGPRPNRAGMVASDTRAAIISALLFAAGVTVDFAPLNLYQSLQLADLLIIGAGLTAAWSTRPQVPDLIKSAAAYVVGRRALLATGIAISLFLLGGAISTGIAGAPTAGVHTWLHFALLALGVAPLLAVALFWVPSAGIFLAAGLVLGSAVQAAGYVIQVLEGAPLYGPRLAGALGSDPLFLLLVGSCVVAAHLGDSVRTLGRKHMLRSHLVWLEVACLILIVAALVLSRSRSAWIGAVAVPPLTVMALTRRAALALGVLAVLIALGTVAYQADAIPTVIAERIQQGLSNEAPDLKARGETLGLLLQEWSEKPWGLGLEQSSGYLPAYLVLGGTGSVHNIVLHALVEMGPLSALGVVLLPLALTWLWLTGTSGESLTRSRRAWPVAALWSVFLAAQATPSFYQHAAWICVGAVIAVSLGPAHSRTTTERMRPQ